MIRTVVKIVILFHILAGISCEKLNFWQRIDDGLFLGEFKINAPLPFNEAIMTILKVDPTVHQFHLLTISEHGHEPLTLPEWCERYHLIGAINAGMYQEDYKSNVGFMKNYTHMNNSHVNSSHHSLAAFNPVDASDTPFFIFDIDEYAADSVIHRYHSIVQNLRLIKSPGENRWSESTKRWCEAALGQDKDGNALFIYCRTPMNMIDFIDTLLQLPIDIVAAMHVEGGLPAALHFSYHGVTKSFSGTAETRFDAEGHAVNATRLPNVIGFSRKN
ncbi:phosphodiester glycosidase family protein [candidate division KSB1 bacterium]|nr:phosphodiester glycosidase family protein [candidate division KSB1 bacterium]